MAANGWKEKMSMQQQGTVMLTFAKDDDKRTAIYQIAVEDGKTTLTITAANE